MTGLRKMSPAPTSTSSLAAARTDIDLHQHGVLPVRVAAPTRSRLAKYQLTPPGNRGARGSVVAPYVQKRSTPVRGARPGQQTLQELAPDGTPPPFRMDRNVLDL